MRTMRTLTIDVNSDVTYKPLDLPFQLDYFGNLVEVIINVQDVSRTAKITTTKIINELNSRDINFYVNKDY